MNDLEQLAALRALKAAKISGDVNTEVRLRKKLITDLQATKDDLSLAREEWATGLARSAADGLTLGSADEIEAGLRTGGGMFGDYTSARDDIRAEQGYWESQNPGTAIGSRMAGGLGTGLIGAGRVAGAQGLGRLWEMFKLGGLTGGLEGMGAAKDLEDIPSSMATGAAIGAPASAALGWGTDRALGALGRQSGELASRTRNALDEQSMDPAMVAERMRAYGPQSTPMETGTAFQTMGARIVGTPGPGRTDLENFITRRAGGSGLSASRAVSDVTGITETGPQIKRRLKSELQREASANYGQTAGEQVDVTPYMRQLLDSDPNMAAATFARMNAERSAIGLPQLREPNIRSLEFWDTAQKYYDDVGKLKPGERVTSSQRIDYLKKQGILQGIDGQPGIEQQIPDYAFARQQFAEKAAALDAVTDGERVLNMPWSKFEDEVSTLSGEARGAYLVGTVDALQNKILGTPDTANAARKLIGSVNMRRKIHTLLPADQADALITRLEGLALQAETYRKAIGGPKTAAMLAEGAQSGVRGLGDAVGRLASGDAMGAFQGIMTILKGQLPEMGDRTRARLADALMTTNPNQAQQLLEDFLTGRRSLEAIERFARSAMATTSNQGASGVSEMTQ